MHYQLDVKGYDPGGYRWKLGKGKPPKDTTIDVYGAYKALWVRWAGLNPELMSELRKGANATGGRLSDCFAHTPVSQARALAEILNGDFD